MNRADIILAIWLAVIVVYAIVGVLLMDDATTHALIAAAMLLGTRALLPLFRRP